MSKTTNPETESSVTCGFFNSLNSDRKYNATQISSIFDGIIKDGVFDSIGTCFVVNANAGNIVNVGIGKAWFDHTWIENDAILPVECDESELLLDRIDAIVIEVDASESVRDCFIKVVNGTPSSDPSNPELTDTTDVHQYALCYIYRTAGSTAITQSNITNMVGTDDTPFVTGILETVSLDKLLGQWRAELDEFIESEETDFTEWYNSMIEELAAKASELDTWTADEKNRYTTWFDALSTTGEDSVNELINTLDTWIASLEEEKKSQCETLVEEMQDLLDDSAAGALQLEIDQLKDGTNKEIFLRYYGLVAQETEFMPDGSIVTTNSESTVTTEFSKDAGGTVVITETVAPNDEETRYIKTTTIKPANGAENQTVTEEYKTEN